MRNVPIVMVRIDGLSETPSVAAVLSSRVEVLQVVVTLFYIIVLSFAVVDTQGC